MVDQLIEEAKRYEFTSVCINPHWVKYCTEKLQDTQIKVCTVIGFPLGATATKTKVYETKQAIKDGATEVDMVINMGELKSNHDDNVKQDIAAVVQAAGHDALTKVIIEKDQLTEDERAGDHRLDMK